MVGPPWVLIGSAKNHASREHGRGNVRPKPDGLILVTPSHRFKGVSAVSSRDAIPLGGTAQAGSDFEAT